MTNSGTKTRRVFLRHLTLLGGLLLLHSLQPDAVVWAQETQNIVLISGNGPVGGRDSANRFTLDGGVTFQDAYIVNPNPLYNVIMGTAYISRSADSSGPVGTTRYETTFTLPTNFSNPSLAIQIHADNQAVILLNGTQIGSQSPSGGFSNFQDPPESYSTNNPSLFHAGANTLRFDIYNSDGPTAFDYKATVSFFNPCGDGNPCTDDSFDSPSGACVYTNNTALCNDGNACTQTDTCQAGSCTGSNPVVCTALDQCHVAGTCDTSTGVCSNPAKPNGTTCSDGNACTQTDTCQAGSCAGSNEPDGTTCNDGNACTQTDTCQAGSCTGANPVVCTALDQCHVAGTCAPATGLCSNPLKPPLSPCNDGNLCTQLDRCFGATCLGQNPVVCTALDQCHVAGTCNASTGVCSNPDKADGTSCNDSNACTQTDTCQAGSCSGGNPVLCSALDQCHDVGTCNASTGVCSNPNKADGSSCSDGDACTQTDTCQEGSCSSGTPVVCTALDQCHVAGTCDTSTGICSNPNKADGSSCSDGDACTQTDTCQGGACSGINPVVCSALDQCHVPGTCDTSTGICSNPNKADGSSCSDGDACTQTDSCQAGSCTGSNPVVCSALDQCHEIGICSPGNGICSNPFKPEGTACNDGSACTTSDTCNGGVCVGGPPPLEVCNAVDDNCDGTIDEGCVGKATGGGEIVVPGGSANFGFVAQRKMIGEDPKGQLEYYNHARSLNVHSTSIQTLTVSGNTATFTGQCTKNQAPCTFSASVDDNGEPGGNEDKFSIAVSGEPVEGAAGPIQKGNIQIHASAMAQPELLIPGESTNAFTGAGSGLYPPGTSFNGVTLTGLHFGTGVNVPGDSSADGAHEATLQGVSPLGLPQTISLETDVVTGSVTDDGTIYIAGACHVDMGDGSPPLTGVPFSLAATTGAQGQSTVALVIDAISLPAATIDQGGITPPACSPEVGNPLTFTDSQSLIWPSETVSSYSVYKGSISGAWNYNHACFVSSLVNPGATDSTAPQLGAAFYYLVSGRNACGESSLGARSNGQARPNSSPCP